ncbi:hypothetical protein LSAT2_015152 [Lamellibrachia satsuma]|nr:hypothetical protein LSAT2_015152 [Lamellibrachia satsuma]
MEDVSADVGSGLLKSHDRHRCPEKSCSALGRPDGAHLKYPVESTLCPVFSRNKINNAISSCRRNNEIALQRYDLPSGILTGVHYAMIPHLVRRPSPDSAAKLRRFPPLGSNGVTPRGASLPSRARQPISAAISILRAGVDGNNERFLVLLWKVAFGWRFVASYGNAPRHCNVTPIHRLAVAARTSLWT